MNGTIQRTKEILSDPDAALSEEVYMVGLLAIAVVAAGVSGPETDEAREIVLAFWREMAVAS